MWTFVTCDRAEVCTQVVKKMELLRRSSFDIRVQMDTGSRAHLEGRNIWPEFYYPSKITFYRVFFT